MIPSGAPRYLARKTAQLQQRRAELIRQLQSVNAELAEITQAATVIRANGKAVKLPDVLVPLKLTQKDRVLAVVRSRPKTGSTLREIVEKLERQNRMIPPNNVSTYLVRLHEDGLIRRHGGRWFPA